jgi:hypothetical protein
MHRLRRLRPGLSGGGDLLIEANAIYRAGDADAVARAEAIVKAHESAHPELMAIDPKDRAAKHGK